MPEMNVLTWTYMINDLSLLIDALNCPSLFQSENPKDSLRFEYAGFLKCLAPEQSPGLRPEERIRIGKELLEAKRMEEENERKRIMALRKAEKEEEKRAREREELLHILYCLPLQFDPLVTKGANTAYMDIELSLVANEDFQHILRVLNTNVDGKQKIMFALTSIKGIGRRFANIVCKKADVDMNKRAGELSAAELENLMTIVANPRQFKIPDWFLNRKKDYKDGRYSQVVSNALDMKLRDDLERLKKIRNHRGLRHYWGLRVRGQHTKTTGRRGKTVGVSKKR
ncbi:uncharacterized protein A4U43_C07F32830 [Asparagus officinalis]|uniref:40S ribosomal protein S18 n=1 Tax=Asparagus officinalis TaxID=4686 RepID=A0A5P1EIL0_ASPOF|nr:uncharacterized protein A4U43_C07F32830 [Asparagus officinalis]